jgi:D-alanine-D-alanine ligase
MTKGLITKRKIGVLMGGFSSEREVSVRSGLAIYQSLQELGYNCVLIDVGRDIVNVLKKEKVKFAFIALHGGIGENGAIQGLLEILGIPYTGSGVLASALAMDKEASRKVFLYHGLSVPPFVVIRQKTKDKKPKTIDSYLPDIDFPLPWVVKPAAEGSSIGVSIVKEKNGLIPSLEKAFSFGPRALIEKFINGKEIHIGILGNRILGGVEVRPSLEFYNYEAKYTSGLTEYIIPPQIDETVYEKVKDIALKAHMALGCSGASRVDLKIDENNTPYVLEVNTLPGMTATSLLPKIARSAGLSFNELIEEMIRLALKE